MSSAVIVHHRDGSKSAYVNSDLPRAMQVKLFGHSRLWKNNLLQYQCITSRGNRHTVHFDTDNQKHGLEILETQDGRPIIVKNWNHGKRVYIEMSM